MAVVYIHKNPQTKEIYYVGIGNLRKRAFHFYDRNDHWKKVYKKYGVIVDIISENISLESAKKMEIFLIQSIGIENLTNKTLGGEGAFGLRHTEELKKRMSKERKGRILSEETKRKIGEKSKGHPNYLLSHTEESKQKLRMIFLGKKRDENFCKRVKESKVGYRPSPKALDASMKQRREKAYLIIELTTGFVGKIWEIEQQFNICRKAVYYNISRNLPILNGSGKGLNFIKYKAYLNT